MIDPFASALGFVIAAALIVLLAVLAGLQESEPVVEADPSRGLLPRDAYTPGQPG